MLVLPQKTDILGNKFKNIMKKYPQFYPERFKLDVLWGQKYIYSEPKLPNIDSRIILKEMSKLKLNAKEKELNQVNPEPLWYPIKLK